MNYLDLFFNLADTPLIGMLMGLILWSTFAALVLLVVEIACFLWLTIHELRTARHDKAVTGKP